MNLLDALLTTSRERLGSIAFFYGISDARQNESSLAEAIASHLLVPAHAMVAIRGLSDEETIALRLITLSSGGSGVVVEQCHRKLNQLSRKWRRNASKVVEVLLARGLVFIRREDYRHIYFVPEDLRSILCGSFLSELYAGAAVEEAKWPPRQGTDFAAPLRHLCLMLSYIRKNEVRLTQSGTIFRKAQNDLSALLDEEEQDASEALSGIRYSPRLALLIYFAKTNGLVEERDGMLHLGRSIESWMEKSYSHWREELFDYWKRTFVAQDPELLTLLWIIRYSPDNLVMSMRRLLDQMETLSTSHSTQGLSARAERNLIGSLEYFGVLETASTASDLLIRVTSLGHRLLESSSLDEQPFEKHVYVQSNFEVLVPCTVEPRILWKIESFADLVKPDQMMVYKISRGSVYRSFLYSYTPQMILHFLETHSKIPVAQNVSYSVSQWAMSFGRIEFEEVILIKCDSEELADELMLSPKIRPHLKERIGPSCLVVKPGAYEQLVSILSDEGYMPKVSSAFGLTPQPAQTP